MSRVDEIHYIDEQHQGDEQKHGNAIHCIFPLRGDAFVEEDFRKGEKDAAAIKRGDGEEIKHTERYAENTDQVQGPVRGACVGGCA